MRFWDSSALVPLVVEQAASKACRQALRSSPRQMVWVLSRTEVISALCRLRREDALGEAGLRAAEARLGRLAGRWSEVDAIAPVRERAERLLRDHPLRSADACQLGAALVATDDRPRRRGFVTLDRGLAAAARGEGFEVLEPA